MATFVLVHGAWHGGWCWSRVTPKLLALGHNVFTPTMTGFGERSHLLSPEIGLDTNILDIENVIIWEDLSEVILVAASYAGMVTTCVADRMPERISALVYQNAFIASDGVSQNDLLPEWRKVMIEENIEDDWCMPPPDPKLFGVQSSDDRDWIRSKMTPQAAKSFRDKARVTGAHCSVTNRTYIRATGYPNETFDRYLNEAQSDPTWRAEVLNTSHDAMITLPNEIVQIFIEVSDSIGHQA
jgi:pimeloyl-ACP methyl ester carboxylesterase